MTPPFSIPRHGLPGLRPCPAQAAGFGRPGRACRGDTQEACRPTHWYRIKRWGSGRVGALCRVLAKSRNGSILIEFEDGFRMVTTRYGVRKIGGMNG